MYRTFWRTKKSMTTVSLPLTSTSSLADSPKTAIRGKAMLNTPAESTLIPNMYLQFAALKVWRMGTLRPYLGSSGTPRPRMSTAMMLGIRAKAKTPLKPKA